MNKMLDGVIAENPRYTWEQWFKKEMKESMPISCMHDAVDAPIPDAVQVYRKLLNEFDASITIKSSALFVKTIMDALHDCDQRCDAAHAQVSLDQEYEEKMNAYDRKHDPLNARR